MLRASLAGFWFAVSMYIQSRGLVSGCNWLKRGCRAAPYARPRRVRHSGQAFPHAPRLAASPRRRRGPAGSRKCRRCDCRSRIFPSVRRPANTGPTATSRSAVHVQPRQFGEGMKELCFPERPLSLATTSGAGNHAPEHQSTSYSHAGGFRSGRPTQTIAVTPRGQLPIAPVDHQFRGGKSDRLARLQRAIVEVEHRHAAAGKPPQNLVAKLRVFHDQPQPLGLRGS